ncbi:MAG: hypothetical protein KDH15_01335 [Rhodocyclaceae bacterium]|nr:hypothetical protein [Rhodocyclaceae bacterium]
MKSRPLQILLALALLVMTLALAYPMYVDYREREISAEIVERYREIESRIRAHLDDAGESADCAALSAMVDGRALQFDGVTVDIGFAPVELGARRGYRPVFVVCGATGQGHALDVARYAHRHFAAINRIEAGPVVRDSVVGFAAPLSAPDHIACFVPSPELPRLCGRTYPPTKGEDAG